MLVDHEQAVGGLHTILSYLKQSNCITSDDAYNYNRGMYFNYLLAKTRCRCITSIHESQFTDNTYTPWASQDAYEQHRYIMIIVLLPVLCYGTPWFLQFTRKMKPLMDVSAFIFPISVIVVCIFSVADSGTLSIVNGYHTILFWFIVLPLYQLHRAVLQIRNYNVQAHHKLREGGLGIILCLAILVELYYDYDETYTWDVTFSVCSLGGVVHIVFIFGNDVMPNIQNIQYITKILFTISYIYWRCFGSGTCSTWWLFAHNHIMAIMSVMLMLHIMITAALTVNLPIATTKLQFASSMDKMRLHLY